MLNILSFRNAKRSIKDYLIYIATMTLIAALMFAFNGMIFSEIIRQLLVDATGLIVFIGLASFFVVIIVIWLTKYIINFMLERRSKEFGNYLLIGMTKKQVAKLFKREHLIMGGFTFLLGIIPGYLLSIAITNIFFSLMGIECHYTFDISIYTYLLTLSYYFVAYFFALRGIRKKIKKMEIRELLYLENQNEETRNTSNKFLLMVFFGSTLYIIIFHILVFTGRLISSLAWPAFALLIAAIYGLFFGLSSFLVQYIQKSKKTMNKFANLFIFRQLASKIKTMRFTMGTLTILFIVTLLSWTSVLMFNGYNKEAFDSNLMPIDVLYFDDDPNTDFAKQKELIEKTNVITNEYSYRIYENGSTSLNAYLYNEVDFMTKSQKNIYFGFDTYMLLSDYNELRVMTGFEQITLKDGHYLIQGKERLQSTLDNYGTQHELQFNQELLQFQGVETIPFTQSGMNGADYLIIVSDNYSEVLRPYFSVFAANLEIKPTPQLEQDLKKTFPYMDEEQSMVYTKMKLDYGTGSDQVISIGSPIIIRNTLIEEGNTVLNGMSLALGYTGVVFLIVAMSILAIQQLADASKYKFRYKILKNLGVSQKERNQIVFKQLAIFYFCPVIMSVIISMYLGNSMSSNFVLLTGLNIGGSFYYLISLLVYLSIFLVYFMITYIFFIRMLDSE